MTNDNAWDALVQKITLYFKVLSLAPIVGNSKQRPTL